MCSIYRTSFHNDKHLGICIANKQLQMQICINFGTISYNFQTFYSYYEQLGQIHVFIVYQVCKWQNYKVLRKSSLFLIILRYGFLAYRFNLKMAEKKSILGKKWSFEFFYHYSWKQKSLQYSNLGPAVGKSKLMTDFSSQFCVH